MSRFCLEDDCKEIAFYGKKYLKPLHCKTHKKKIEKNVYNRMPQIL